MNWDELKQNEDKLANLVNENSACEVARQFEVDHKTVMYWLDKYGYSYINNSWQKQTVEIQDENKYDYVKDQDKITKEEFPGYYLIYNDKQEVQISKHKLEKIYQWYCEDGLAQDTVCNKASIPFEDFKFIKRAFGFVHSSIPHPEHEIRKKTVEELVDDRIERKKQRYDEIYQQKEISRLKRIEKKYKTKQHFIDIINKKVSEHFINFNKEYEGPLLPTNQNIKCELLLEVPIVDLHLAKLSWGPETGENYDCKIAQKRFMKVIYDVMEQTRGMVFEKIIFPVGNDFFNFDDIAGKTTAGTPQTSDSRWQKMFCVGIELLIKAIDILGQLAPIDVFLVPGNHDQQTSYYAMMYLSAWYKENQSVEVDTNPQARKYREFGNNLLGFTHSDKEKRRIYGCMQIEAREAWGRTKYQEWHGAHLHSEQVKEDMGVIVRQLTTVAAKDDWHYEKGYLSVAKSQSFIWDKEKGLRKILFTTID